MNFPHHDIFWRSARDFLLKCVGEQARILAPTEFHEIFPNTFSYNVADLVDPESLDMLVIHKGMLPEIGEKTCTMLVDKGLPIHANEVFVVFALKGRHKKLGKRDQEHLNAFYALARDKATFKAPASRLHSEFSEPATVILMTTYNRPERLARSLETIAPLKAPILVVNDGSDACHAGAYAGIAKNFDVRMLNMPGNRGLSNALNAGLSYWLADPLAEWICYLQDDVEVRADLLTALARVQDLEKRPILSGRHNPLHKTYGEGEINGVKVLYQRMSPGIHLHAHRAYWEKMIPIPTVYFQAPRKWPGAPLRGADEDWWISQWSPHSIVKRGGYITVIPGLVRTTTALAEESTWGNPGEPDPPLPPPQLEQMASARPELPPKETDGRNENPLPVQKGIGLRDIFSFSGVLQKARWFLKPPQETVFLKQYGEKRTGTNFLRAILLYNHGNVVPLMHVLGDKHSPPVDFDSLLEQTKPLPDPGWEFVNRATFAAAAEGSRADDPQRIDHMRQLADALALSVKNKHLGFLISLKHPYAWASSLARYSGWMSEIDGVFQMNPIHGEQLRDACVGYNKRHAAWLALHERNRHRSVLVRHEDLLDRPDKVIAGIERKFGLRRPPGPLRLPDRKVHPTPWDQESPLLAREAFDPDFYKSRKYQERLRKELWEIVIGTIDWKLMKRCGYRRMPLPFQADVLNT